MSTQKSSFRLPDKTKERIVAMTTRDRTMTDVVVMAVDLLHDHAVHDDTVEIMIEELRTLRKKADQQLELCGSLSSRLSSVESIAATVSGFEKAIDKLGEHQLQLADAVSRLISPADRPKTGLWGVR